MTRTYDLWTAFQIPILLTLEQSKFEIPIKYLPSHSITGLIVTPSPRQSRCKLETKSTLFKGSRGWIDLASRRCLLTPSATEQTVCIKRPHDPEYSLVPEALLQHVSYEELESLGIHGAIPRVYDLYDHMGQTHFTMEYIHGLSALDALLSWPSPDTLLLQILEQVCFLLAILEATIGFDHRDLKADNLWIRPTPTQMSIILAGKRYTISAPFQVVLLDFGFGCLGGEEMSEGGSAVVSLTDGLVPKIDPCPKSGRDLFYLLFTTWSVPEVQGRMSAATRAWIEDLLQGPSRDGLFTRLLQTFGPSWIHTIVNDVRFRIPSLRPLPFLAELAARGGSESTVKIESMEAEKGGH